MTKYKLLEILEFRETSITMGHILDNSKADSGGKRDVDFLNFLINEKILVLGEAILKRVNIGFPEEHYLDRYKKVNYESDRHFLCRAIIQDEFKNKGIETIPSVDIGDMDILRENSNYDISVSDLSAAIDIGLTPARNYFRGLTDRRMHIYLITTYFDDYMDDIIFSTFSRTDDDRFFDAVRDFEEGFKQYIFHPEPVVDDKINPNLI